MDQKNHLEIVIAVIHDVKCVWVLADTFAGGAIEATTSNTVFGTTPKTFFFTAQ